MNTPEGLRNDRDRKQNKTEYGILLLDLEDKGWIVSYDTIEIGSLGHFTSSATIIQCTPRGTNKFKALPQKELIEYSIIIRVYGGILWSLNIWVVCQTAIEQTCGRLRRESKCRDCKYYPHALPF